ncbi:MAG: RNA-binding S4 domain-containing protein [Clostridiales Family XIII bacterium]|jgi:ribosomal 50S subunit-recycling heat shock protein|nr:RNA-binding S4 domain-containing protein [Clostridiales Family XIII bacterium]
MRIDKFLKVSRIIKRRTVAKEACDLGRVEIGGRVVKAGAEVSPGDEITVHFGKNDLKVRVRSLAESTKKEDAADMYEVLS